jgi:geranylgeranyl diphosphate synthase type II
MDSRFESALDTLSASVLGTAPTSLRESIRYSLLSGGKRFRPRMLIAVAKTLGLSSDAELRLAAAIEMIHAYTLIHDDLPAMDNDDFRRGKPTNHKVYGEATAILAGDSLALLSFDLLTPLRGEIPAENILEVTRILLEAAGARGVIAGQVAELELRAGKALRSEETLFEIFRLKTGALFRAALSVPFAAAGKTPPAILILLGETIGIAFQIADDLEDDFAAERGNPVHIAAYLTQNEARLKAEEMLSASFAAYADENAKVAGALRPFIDELLEKISESASS